MTDFYTEMVETVHELLNEFGRECSLLLYSNIPADASFPWDGPAAPTVTDTVITVGAFVPISSLKDLGIHVTNEDLLKLTEQAVLLPPDSSGKDLSKYTKLTDGVNYTIRWVEILKPGDTVLLYAMGVSR